MVAIAALLEYLVEGGSTGTNIHTVGDAFWWAGSTLTTIGSPLYPVTTGGKIVAFALMLYAISVFTYFVASLASVLVGHDNDAEAREDADEDVDRFRLTPEEAQVPRRALARMARVRSVDEEDRAQAA